MSPLATEQTYPFWNPTSSSNSSTIRKLVPFIPTTQELSATELDILYYQATKNTETLTLLQFQQLLLKLAQRLYTEVPLAQAFHQLFENHFVDLYEKIATRTDFGEGLRQI